jgi:hypothetical protein
MVSLGVNKKGSFYPTNLSELNTSLLELETEAISVWTSKQITISRKLRLQRYYLAYLPISVASVLAFDIVLKSNGGS